MRLVVILIIVCIAAYFLCYYCRKYYYLSHMRQVIFPVVFENIQLGDEKNMYERFRSALYKEPTEDEMIFLLKYKKLVDLPNVYSMAAADKVKQTTDIIRNVITNKIPGSFVETGVWKGGMGMWMKNLLNYYCDKTRDIWLYDTFEYFPHEKTEDELDTKIHPVTQILFENMQSVETVRNNFQKFNLLDSHVHLIPGEFSNTLTTTDPGTIAVLRLDSDYYTSTLFVLDKLYDKVAIGGYVIVDDYGNPYVGCRKAVDEFRQKRGITTPLQDTHMESVYWRK